MLNIYRPMLNESYESLLIENGLYDTEFEVAESSRITVRSTLIAVLTVDSVILTLANKAL